MYNIRYISVRISTYVYIYIYVCIDSIDLTLYYISID